MFNKSSTGKNAPKKVLRWSEIRIKITQKWKMVQIVFQWPTVVWGMTCISIIEVNNLFSDLSYYYGNSNDVNFSIYWINAVWLQHVYKCWENFQWFMEIYSHYLVSTCSCIIQWISLRGISSSILKDFRRDLNLT